MAKKKKKAEIILPKLIERGKRGNYSFRMKVDGKDKWVSTGTNDEKLATEFMIKKIGAEESTRALAKIEKDSRKLADAYVQTITGKEEVSIKLDEALDKWISTQPRYNKTSEERRQNHKNKFTCFKDWCANKDIFYVEQVSNEIALQYASYLCDEKYAPSTFNETVAFLSNVFSTFDKVFGTINRDPFDKKIVARFGKSELNTAEHKALEPSELQSVMEESVKHGQATVDLFIILSQTGMRLKDAALLKWDSVQDNFLYFQTYKTDVYARPPITKMIREVLDRRQRKNGDSEYVFPEIAELYFKDRSYVSNLGKRVFEDALGKEKTIYPKGESRRINTAKYSIHSFRSTFMSLLAMKGVSIRDAMTILGWNTQEMVQLYERMLEAARGDSDRRTFDLVNSIDELNMSLPEAPPAPLRPTKEFLEELTSKYSNIAIGKIFGISDSAISQWMKKFGVERVSRVVSKDVSDEEIAQVRKELTDRLNSQ